MMGWVIAVLIVAGIVGMVIWNHRTRAAALEGVRFELSADPGTVRAALRSSYISGGRARLRTIGSGLRFTEFADGLGYETKTGDTGRLTVQPRPGGGTVVEAAAEKLFLGHPWILKDSGGCCLAGIFWLPAVLISHGIFRGLGIAPNASRLKRFQNGVEERLVKEIGKSSQGGSTA